MLRKSLFAGITMLLAAVLVWLIIQGRKTAPPAAPGSDISRETKSTTTRVIAPRDLEIVELGNKGAATGIADQVVIRNRGRVAYFELVLKITYTGKSGKILLARTQPVPETIDPGMVFTGKLDNSGMPPGAAGSRVEILHAQIKPGAD